MTLSGMEDTQWPRYQVFVQERPGAAHQDAGSVHASDIEMALLNARDVFARRPECVSMWVAPAEAIYSRTAQELQAEEQTPPIGPHPGGPPPAGPPETYYVFCKRKSAGTQTLAGEVQAGSPQQALALGRAAYAGPKPPFAWWVIPARRVAQTDPQDVETFFAPALDKPFRLSTEFRTHSAMQQVKRGSGAGKLTAEDGNARADESYTDDTCAIQPGEAQPVEEQE